MRVQNVVQIVHGAQVIDEHLALRDLGIVDAGVVAARIAGDLDVPAPNGLEDLVVAQIAIVEASLDEVIQQHLDAALGGLKRCDF